MPSRGTLEAMHSAFDPTRPFTFAEGIAVGIGPRALRGRQYRKVFPGVYVAAHIPDTLVVRCRAALRVLPSDAVFSHHTAARLWAGSAPDDPNLHVSFLRPVSSRLPGIKIHRFTQQFASHRRHGLPVTSPEQTVIHLTRPLDLVELVACADQLVRRKVTSPQDLVVAAGRWTGQGAALARQAGLLSREAVDSVTETKVRLLMVLAGLPEPVVNHKIRRADGTVEYRLDLSFPDHLLAIEYDGRWHDDPEQRLLDEARREELGRRGWRFVVLHAEDIFETPDETLARLHLELAQRGIPVPAVLDDAWRRHFPLRGLVSLPA
jgi:very-short-patch-repair endonuclease